MARPVWVFFGHHKTATRWVGRILEQLAQAAGLHYRAVSNPKWFGFDLARLVEAEQIDILNYMNAERKFAAQLTAMRGFHLVRDPRDMSVSAYFSHRYSHSTEYWPELAEHRAQLAPLSDADGLLLDMQFTDMLPTDGYALQPYRAMQGWNYHQDNVLELMYESVAADPLNHFLRVAEFLGLPTRQTWVAQAVRDNAFERLSGGRPAGLEDPFHHYRRGTPGDWSNHFGPLHRQFFHAHYDPLVLQLGYEQRTDW